jgi:isopentenyl diphosphate isomerase/L-lactate dehydrogenase-like FMN-dependent dehydrogenase
MADDTQRTTLAPAPPQFTNLEQLAGLAATVMPRMAHDYYASGAETETSVADNRAAFGRYRLLPRILVDVSAVDTSCSCPASGVKQSFPVLVAPMAMHGLAHHERELGTARGAAAAGVPMVRGGGGGGARRP